MAGPEGTILIEDAQIIFRNFAGKEGMYNREGDRNFGVLVDKELADQLVADGWNVKTLRAREEGDEEQPWLPVSVGYKVRPPMLVLLSSKGRVNLGQHEAEVLDWVDIAKADLIVRPYNWNVNGKSGVKAYVKSLFVTMAEDELEQKYSDIPYAEIESSGPRELAPKPDEDIVDAEIVEESDG